MLRWMVVLLAGGVLGLGSAAGLPVSCPAAQAAPEPGYFLGAVAQRAGLFLWLIRRRAGAVVTTMEMVMHEMVERVDFPQFDKFQELLGTIGR